MLLFLAALQNIGAELERGGDDGRRERLAAVLARHPPACCGPRSSPVLTLGLIGTWQVFDQIYIGDPGRPGQDDPDPRVPVLPAAFENQKWGQGAAIAFILFVIIVVFTLFQRWVLREREAAAPIRSPGAGPAPAREGTVMTATPSVGARRRASTALRRRLDAGGC